MMLCSNDRDVKCDDLVCYVNQLINYHVESTFKVYYQIKQARE